MTKRYVAILLVLGLGGCHDHLTTQEIVEQTKQCKAAGLSARYFERVLEPGAIVEIQCVPKELSSVERPTTREER
jgi:hypothetical protein